ncbi:MAG: ATP-dependent Clp protease ATP-binding subunit [Candidatus Eremiobacteraeota bacterium]|nr:ATP-dependent Clp protease ATP-binding subunit [Candidatus Eremiobacteraeota bacterium]
MSALKLCERCGKQPASGATPTFRNGRFTVTSLCAQCMAANNKDAMQWMGGAALAALALGVGAVLVGDQIARAKRDESGTPVMGSPQPARTMGFGGAGRTPTLNAFSRDLSRQAVEGRLDPVIGRDVEINRIVRILARRTKNNPVLIGDAGVGKTAIVEGLAQRIVRGDVPRALAGKRILALTLAGVVAGTKYRGEFEARLHRMLEELARASDVIVFIDELHTIVGAGSAEGSTVDAANMLKPALARGEIRCIGATTFDEYRRYIESDEALERRFAPIVIDEPSPESALAMLRGSRARYETHHGVRIADSALASAISLSSRYIADRNLPDKAFDVLDEASALVALRGGTDVGPNDIARVVAGWTGIPVETVAGAEAARLVNFEALLRERVVGQDDAVRAVAEAVRRGRAGMKEHRGPMGALLLVGPSGVGKTELARATAAALFGSDDALVRFDMSEFAAAQSATRLIGAPRGYAGHERAGELTEAVRRRPYSVLLFDDIDRAHPEVLDLLLQLLDDGRLTDSNSRTVDFRNTLVILTANAPAGSDLSQLGAQFSHELVNRLDDAVAFHQLGREDIRAIAARHVKNVIAAAAEKGISVQVSDAALDAIAAEADDQRQGARLVRRVIERRLSAPLAKGVLAGDFARGKTVRVDVAPRGELDLKLCDSPS